MILPNFCRKKSAKNGRGETFDLSMAGLRYQLLYPTLILSFVTIAFYLIGNAFSDAADPKNHLQYPVSSGRSMHL